MTLFRIFATSVQLSNPTGLPGRYLRLLARVRNAENKIYLTFPPTSMNPNNLLDKPAGFKWLIPPEQLQQLYCP